MHAFMMFVSFFPRYAILDLLFELVESTVYFISSAVLPIRGLDIYHCL